MRYINPLRTSKKNESNHQSISTSARPATPTNLSATSTATIKSINTPTVRTDNIFVPIQPDDILPQIPIGQQHPVPRKGIEDDEYRTLHTNKFYANAFLGEQNQPIWTHPYVLWWGKGKDAGVFPSWGMNVGHCEEEHVMYDKGKTAKVRSLW